MGVVLGRASPHCEENGKDEMLPLTMDESGPHI
jgi:hypothetical protein